MNLLKCDSFFSYEVMHALFRKFNDLENHHKSKHRMLEIKTFYMANLKVLKNEFYNEGHLKL